MLSFLAPLFLAGAAAAALPIVLHLLKRQPEARVKFAAVKMLKRAPVEHTQKRHLRQLILLALRVTALILLALAFARPFFATGAALGTAGVTIVALDTSMSVSAPGRFERAKDLARAAIGRVPASDLVGVVTFDDEAEIVARPSADRVLASSAVDDAQAGYGATRYRAALSAAAQQLNGRKGTIVVVTDLQENGWDAGDRASVPEGTTIEVADIGAMPPNLSVTGIRALSDRVVATVHNSGARARDARVHLAIDDRPPTTVTVPLGPNQSADATFAGAPRGASATVAVDDGEGLAADNVRYAILGGANRPSVLVVSASGDLNRDAFYVQHALAAAAAGTPAFQVQGVGGAQLSTWSDERLAGQAAIFLVSTRGLERRGRELLASYARGGGGLLVASGTEMDGSIVTDVLGAASTLTIAPANGIRQEARALAPTDVRHPVFQPFAGSAATLGFVNFQTAVRIAGSACQTLARFTTGEPALLECPSGDGRALVFASDLNNRWNDFPLHATFVPFLHEVVRYLASTRAHASEYFVGAAPAGVRRTPGLATIDAAGVQRRIAINVDPREADPARISVEDFQSAVTRLKSEGGVEARVEARQQEDRQHLWQYALALMAGLLAVEGLLAARTA